MPIVYEPRTPDEVLDLDPETGQPIVVKRPKVDSTPLMLALSLLASIVGVVVVIIVIAVLEYHDLLWG